MMDFTPPVRLKVSHAPTVVVVTDSNAAIVAAMLRSVRGLGNCPTCHSPTYVPCITSGADGIHSAGSQHYRNSALDFRLSDFPLGSRDTVLRALSEEIGDTYVYRVDTDHIHVERRRA